MVQNRNTLSVTIKMAVIEHPCLNRALPTGILINSSNQQAKFERETHRDPQVHRMVHLETTAVAEMNTITIE